MERPSQAGTGDVHHALRLILVQVPNPRQQTHTHRLLSGSFLGLPYRILNMNHKKELLRSLWVFSTCKNQEDPGSGFASNHGLGFRGLGV